METDHNKIVEEIERKMAGPSMLKSEQEKKQQIFEYQQPESSNLRYSDSHTNGNSLKRQSFISMIQAQKSLKQIYDFYVNSYIQPRQHLYTFDTANQRRLNFQPYILFTKHFNLLKTVYPLEKIKLYFKKYSNFGQYLTLQNFIFLIKQISHEPEAKAYFNIKQTGNNDSQFNVESMEQTQLQHMFHYLKLQNPQKYRNNFKNLFQPFCCKQKIETKKIKYTYRKFSQPQLLKKSISFKKNQTQQKQLYVVKNKQIEPPPQNPLSQFKSIVVSWESLRSKSLISLQKTSQDIVRKKYIKDDPDDDLYLKQYEDKHQNQKKRLQRKISVLTTQQENKNKLLLAKLQLKTQPKSLLIKKSH